jgi:phosphatidate cytidylyltransferase
MLLALLIVISGTLGDLVESMLKRSLGIKDSGSILPGHGGLLDRFDAVLLSAPFVFVYLALFCR